MMWKVKLLLKVLDFQTKHPIEEMTPEQARRVTEASFERGKKWTNYPPIELFRVFDQNILGRECEIPIRIYQPKNEDHLPIILFFHGGGFVLRNQNSYDKVCRRIARDTEAIVISVDYRLAPEHKYPKAVYDCYDATKWAYENAALIGGKADTLVVMGDSAGGNLAAAVSLMSRDLNGPAIQHQVLIYPATDARLILPSIEKYGHGFLLTKSMIRWFVNHYIRTEDDIYEPYLSVLLARDLSNLPPALIITAEYDPLIDEGLAYAKRLKKAGVMVQYSEYKGLIHAFMNLPKIHKSILGAYLEIEATLKRTWRKKRKRTSLGMLNK